MFKRTFQILMTIVLMVSVLMAGGCQNDAMTGAGVGTLAGAGIGQLAGGDTESTLIGAAIGAGAGYIIGNESERKKTDNEMRYIRQEMNSRTVKVTNSNGSIIMVKLRRQGVGWVGTAGEYYGTLPTDDQLRPVYGF